MKMRCALILLILFGLISQAAAQDMRDYVELVSNTDSCFSKCEAVLKITNLPIAIQIPSQANSDWKWEFTKRDEKMAGLKSYEFQILETEAYAVDEYKTVDYNIFAEKNGLGCDSFGWTWKDYNATHCYHQNNKQVVVGSHLAYRDVWKPFDFWGKQLPSGKTIYIKIIGYKNFTWTEEGYKNDVDWAATLNGVTFKEWAWWDADWDYRNEITITANRDLNIGLSIDLNSDHLLLKDLWVSGKVQADFDDVRITYGESTEISRSIEQYFAGDMNRIWFQLQAPITAGNSDTYYIYYGNPLAAAPTYNTDFNAPALDYNASTPNATYALYHLNEGVGTTAHDSSPNKRDATIHNAEWGSVDIDGNHSLAFNWADTNVVLPFEPIDLNFTGYGTIEIFFRIQPGHYFGSGTYQCHKLIGASDVAAANLFWIEVCTHLDDVHPYQWGIGFYNKDAAGYHWEKWTGYLAAYSDINNGLVHSIAATWSPTGMTGWYDGSAISTAGGNQWNTSEIADVGCNLTLGARTVCDSHDVDWVDGNILSVRISTFDKSKFFQTYNAAISPAKIEVAGMATPIDANYINIGFVDENRFTRITNPTVTIGSTTYDTNEGHLFIWTHGWTKGKYIMTAYDTNHSTRYWYLDVNGSKIDFNAMLLPTSLGADIAFKFYAPDKTTILSNAIVSVSKVGQQDKNIMGSRLTNASGEVTFFINPDQNTYRFDINYSGTHYTYYFQRLTVNIPKDEKTLANITPFSVRASGIGSQIFTDRTTGLYAYLLPDTAEYYRIDVNANGYYTRSYMRQVRGGEATATLQPYLVNSTDGIAPVVYIKDNVGLTGLEGIRVVIEKFITGEGVVEVQSAVSDTAGTVYVSFWANDNYWLTFYDEDGTALWEDAPLQPISTTYNFFLATQTYSEAPYAPVEWTVNFYPATPYVQMHGDMNRYVDFNVWVDLRNTSVASIDVNVFSDMNGFYHTTATTEGWLYLYDVNVAGQMPSTTVTVKLVITTTNGGSFTVFKNFTMVTANELRYDLYGMLAAFPALWDLGLTMTTLFAVIITIMIVGAALRANLAYESSGVTVLALISMGLFTSIGWVKIELYIFMCLVGFFMVVLARRI